MAAGGRIYLDAPGGTQICQPAIDAIAAHLAEAGIFAWSGHFYAVEVIARLGLAESGGLVRLGFCHYHTADEVDRTIAALRAL